MSRPLTGSWKKVANGWWGELADRNGSRKSYVFLAEGARERWLTAGIAARRAGESLPAPPTADLFNAFQRGTRFATIGASWAAERYATLKRGQVDRQRAAERHIKPSATGSARQGCSDRWAPSGTA